MKRKMFLASLLALALTMMAAAQSIPAGTHIPVRIGSELSSGTARAGQTWEGTVARDVVVNGRTVLRSGDPARGVVSAVESSGRLHHPGILKVKLTSVAGRTVRTGLVSRQGQSHTKSNITKVGGGAAAGAVIGAIAGGGKGAAIGSLAGGAAGTGVAAATGKKEAVIPAETTLTFTTTAATASAARSRK